jgi:ribose 5-phosphate isomerase B
VKIAIGSDHAGFRLKRELLPVLDELQVAYEDVGTFDESSVDYPDYGRLVAEKVAKGEVNRGILICGTGLGMCITANKVNGIRAVTCNDEFSARLSRLHNNANILTIGERVIGPGVAADIIRVWLTTEFAGGRHQRRIDKVMELEKNR